MMYSETPALEPIVPAYRLRILADEQLADSKSGALEILEEVGIHCPSEKALDIYAEHGAQVDFESQIVRLPPDVVLEGCTLLYPEAVLLDTDIYHRVRIDAAGLDTSRRALALDVIKAVGPRGHFLRQKHTRTHMRRREFSDLTSQPGDGGGYRDPIELAREKVDWILENHHPKPLEEATQAELKRILRAAERELE